MKIPHSKPFVDEEDAEEVKRIIESGMHATGEKVKEFEDEFCIGMDVNYAKAVNSGTSALHIALLALGVKRGDEVIIPSYVCQSLLNAVNQTGATAIFADIQRGFTKRGYNISAENIESLISEETKSIILPHMFGCPADLEKIIELRNEYKIPLIEDCCQSLSAKYKDKLIGSFGDIGIFSFYATKVISTGQGGMVITSSEKLKEKIQDLTTYDQKKTYSVGYNYAMTNIQASLGITQLEKLEDFIQKRKEIGEKYDNAFQNLNFKLNPKNEGSFPFRYVIQLNNEEKRNELQTKLKEQGITAENPVFKPLHQYLNLNPKDFPNTEQAYKTCLSIPIYPALTNSEVDYVIENVVSSMKD